MPILDLQNLESGLSLDADVCIIGSGPAGLSIANEFIGTHVQVCVLESGGLEEEYETQLLYTSESIGEPRSGDQDGSRNRILGGSSHTWSGRCAPLDAIDFEERPWVDYSGWPVSYEILKKYEKRAGDILRTGSYVYGEEAFEALVKNPEKRLNADLLRDMFWQYSKVSASIRVPLRFGQYCVPHKEPNINLFLHANVTQLNMRPEGGQITSLSISTLGGKKFLVSAQAFVLCCGGIENARLLLASNSTISSGVGNQYDMVGRFLMDHPGIVLGDFKTVEGFYRVSKYFGDRWLFNANGKHVYDHGIALSPEVQRREELLNCAAFLKPIEDHDDPWEAIKNLRNNLKSDKRVIYDNLWDDVKVVSSNPGRLVHGLWRQFIERRPPIKSAELYCLVEQCPNPNSRVMLSDKKDKLGMPISRVDWRISEQEVRTVQRFGELIAGEFKRLRMPPITLYTTPSHSENSRLTFVDRAHPIGTTRMSINPRMGVTDQNCEVHGVKRLFIAGSSVFPTSSHANPTLAIVALAVRLADYLKSDVLKP
jgi:choline dehydrogenase-like flavoprotein